MPDAKLSTDSGSVREGNLEPAACTYVFPRFSLYTIYYMQLLILSQEQLTIRTRLFFDVLGGCPLWDLKQQEEERSELKGLNFKDWIGFALKVFALWHPQKDILLNPVGF